MPSSNAALKGEPFTFVKEITAHDAWKILSQEPDAMLIDVRTSAEWSFVGVADLSTLGKDVIMLSWKNYPSMQVNADFVKTLSQHITDKKTPLLFLCKTGGRSYDAANAMANVGYTQCYNVLEGFEGAIDPNQHRGTISGWKASRLPWRQQ